MGSLAPKAPVDIKNVGAVLGFVLMVAVTVAVINRIGPVKRIVAG